MSTLASGERKIAQLLGTAGEGDGGARESQQKNMGGLLSLQSIWSFWTSIEKGNLIR